MSVLVTETHAVWQHGNGALGVLSDLRFPQTCLLTCMEWNDCEVTAADVGSVRMATKPDFPYILTEASM